MNRKITELERKLIRNGWLLTQKYYEGKHSERTWCYEYYKTMNCDGDLFGAIVIINPKRDTILDYGIHNIGGELGGINCFNKVCLEELKTHFDFLEYEINEILGSDLTEQLEIAEIMQIEEGE